jgi:hypothetical protein
MPLLQWGGDVVVDERVRRSIFAVLKALSGIEPA